MSRLAACSPTIARLLLAALLLGVILAHVGFAPGRAQLAPRGVEFRDTLLYETIAKRVAAGQGYYAAAAAEHRLRGFPLTPAWVFRAPTLSWFLNALRFDWLRRGVLVGLAVAVVAAGRAALEREGVSVRDRVLAMPLLTCGLWAVVAPHAFYIHELWAGLLMALSLALYRPGRWLPSVILGFLACLFRELAAPFLLAMGAAAMLQGRRREAAGWLAALLLFAALFAAHLWRAQDLYRAGDGVSPGWLVLGGPRFLVAAASCNVPLSLLPAWLLAVVVGLALFGLGATRNAIAARAALICGGYMAAFAVIGRPDNDYWGHLYAPILPLGLVLAIPAIRDLVLQALPFTRRRPSAAAP